MALGLRVENEWGGRVKSKKGGGGEVVKVKWEVVCLGREKEREGRPTGRGEKGGKRRGKECVGREKADNGGVPRSVDLRS
jgi:hypothetical protein